MKWYKVFVSHVPQKKCEPFSASVAGTLLPSAISALGGLASNAMSLFGAQSNRDWQEQENEKNRQWQQKMWNLQNEYNSPLHQRELLKEAGYNPYMYGKESPFVGAGSAGAPAMAGAPALPNFSNPLSGSAQLLQQGLQIESNVELQHAKAMQTLYQTLYEAYEKGGQKLYNQVLDDLSPVLDQFEWNGSRYQQKLDTQLSILGQESRGLEVDIYSRELDTEFKKVRNKWSDILHGDEHNQFVQVLSRIRSEVSEINSRTDLNRQQKRNLISENSGKVIQNGLLGLDFQNRKAAQKDIQNALKLTDEYTENEIQRIHEDASNKHSERRNRDKTRIVGPWSYKDNNFEYDLP